MRILTGAEMASSMTYWKERPPLSVALSSCSAFSYYYHYFLSDITAVILVIYIMKMAIKVLVWSNLV